MDDGKLGVDSGLTVSVPQMFGVWDKGGKSSQLGRQTTGSVLSDMIAPQVNLFVDDKHLLQHSKELVCFRACSNFSSTHVSDLSFAFQTIHHLVFDGKENVNSTQTQCCSVYLVRVDY